ncbi:hypothetical protein E2C01_051621 [Portunus trituberculatus]|uniref:Uncharacterized protein n=1 Tax=Portunus trituberculatus TaxID=210409 RepID=A0A5B7GJ84_PORTR|nr:hypothetical protein [Portunus trituberculatus]
MTITTTVRTSHTTLDDAAPSHSPLRPCRCSLLRSVQGPLAPVRRGFVLQISVSRLLCLSGARLGLTAVLIQFPGHLNLRGVTCSPRILHQGNSSLLNAKFPEP